MKNSLTLNEIVEQMHGEGDFLLSFLGTANGLPVTTAPKSLDSENTAALVAIIQKVIFQTDNKLLRGEIDELTFRCKPNKRLVCRFVYLPTEILNLVIVIPADQPYRRVTNRAVRLVKKYFLEPR